jgi:hypothetical protein
MKRESKSLIVVAALLTLSPFAVAEELFIGCPVELLDAQVTTQLPGEWWTTPQQGALLGTDVRDIAGDQTLVCNYRGFGTSIPVMQKMPAGFLSCVPEAGGFACSTEQFSRADSPNDVVDVATQIRSDAQIPTPSSNDVKVTTQAVVPAPAPSSDVEVTTGQARTDAPVATK